MGRIYDQTWGRGFSALYDRCFSAAEEAGLREMRREVLAGARGRVLEVGAGTGLNLELYPEQGIESLTLSEPDPLMVKQLREKLGESAARGGADPGAGGRSAVRRRQLRHGHGDAGPLHGPRPAGGAAGDPTCPQARRSAALPRARARRGPGPGPLAGPVRASRGASSATAVTATATPSRRSRPPASRSSELEHDRLPKAPPIVRPLVRGSASLSG